MRLSRRSLGICQAAAYIADTTPDFSWQPKVSVEGTFLKLVEWFKACNRLRYRRRRSVTQPNVDHTLTLRLIGIGGCGWLATTAARFRSRQFP